MTPSPTVAVLADDLIWASRLLEAVRRTGASAVRIGSERELDIALQAEAEADPGPDTPGRLAGVVVDLFGQRYDGVAAVGRVAAASLPVICVAQHEDLETRKRALDAGAHRVFSYNKFFTDGPRLVEAWLGRNGGRA
jgi:hypothetical protein